MKLSPSSTRFLYLLGAVTATGALSIDMVLPALPSLGRELDASAESVQLVIGAFLLGFASGQIGLGPVADRFGRRPALLGGMVLFALGAIGCTLAGSIEALVAFRFLQGVGSSSGRVVPPAMVRDAFDPLRVSRALSFLLMVMSVAPLIAPMIGGYLLLAGSWRWIFALLTAVGVALLAIALIALPETITEKQMHAVRPRELVHGYVRVARHPVTLVTTLINTLLFAGVFAYISGSPLVWIGIFNVPSHLFGYLFAATAICLTAGASLNRRLLLRHSPDTMLARGMALCVAASVFLVALGWLRLTGAAGIAAILVPMMLMVMGMSWVMPNSTALGMRPFPKAAGVTSSFMGFTQMSAAAGSSYLVGRLHDGTPLPMIHLVAAGGIGAALLHRFVLKRSAE